MIKETFKKGKGKKAICICDYCGIEFLNQYGYNINKLNEVLNG